MTHLYYYLKNRHNNSVNLYSHHRGRTELGEITVHNLKQLKRLNQVVFPVSYNEKFYTDILTVGEYAKLG